MRLYKLSILNKCILLLCLVLLLSCSRSDPFTNLTTTIIIDDNEAIVEEGDYLIYNLNLSEMLSEPLVLGVDFSIKDVGANYTNAEDYSHYFEYSIDGNQSWTKSDNPSSVELPPFHTSYKLRLATTDDDMPEVLLEKMEIVIYNQNPSRIILRNINIPTLEASIRDNDVPLDLREELDEDGSAIIFLRENDTYKLTAVATSATFIKEKEIIDGLYKDAIDLLSNLSADLFSSIETLLLGFEPYDTLEGAVTPSATFNSDGDFTLSNWQMYLNLSQAYVIRGGRALGNFDANGRLASTIVHELGHVLTLSGTQLKFVDSKSFCDGSTVNESFFIRRNSALNSSGEACFIDSSYINQLLLGFYDVDKDGYVFSKTNLKKPNFVSLYSEVRFSEDIAETFLSFVSKNEDVTTDTKTNSAYLNKILIFQDNPQAVKIKQDIKKSGRYIAGNDKNISSDETPNTSTPNTSRHSAYESCLNRIDYIDLNAFSLKKSEEK